MCSTEKRQRLAEIAGKTREECKQEYVRFAEEMIKKYERKIVRSKWNSEVWTVDY